MSRSFDRLKNKFFYFTLNLDSCLRRNDEKKAMIIGLADRYSVFCPKNLFPATPTITLLNAIYFTSNLNSCWRLSSCSMETGMARRRQLAIGLAVEIMRVHKKTAPLTQQITAQ